MKSRLLLLLALLPLLLSCSQPVEPLRLGTNLWPGYEPLYVAQERGYWSTDSVRLVEYPSASEVLRAFRNRSLDAAAITLDEVLTLRERGFPVTVFLVLDLSDGGDVILARPEIASMEGLRSKRVAVESGALGAFVVSRALEIHGVDAAEVEIIHLPVDAHEEAYLDNQTDAVVTFEPVRTRLLSAGAREIFSSREIPGEIVDVLAVHGKHLESSARQAQLRAVVAGWFKATALLRDHPDEAAALIAHRLHITPAEVMSGYEGLRLPTRQENQTLLGGTNPTLAQSLGRLHRSMVAHGLLSPQVAIDGVITDAYVVDGSGPSAQ